MQTCVRRNVRGSSHTPSIKIMLLFAARSDSVMMCSGVTPNSVIVFHIILLSSAKNDSVMVCSGVMSDSVMVSHSNGSFPGSSCSWLLEAS